MDWLMFTYLLVLAVFGLHQGVAAQKPKMIPEHEELIIQEGEELTIKCQGDESLQFSTEEVGNARKLNFRSSYDEHTGYHTFTFTNTTYENTGWYACAEAGIELRNNDQTIDHPSDDISWIYVYVNSSEQFAEKGDFRMLTAKVGGTIVIPCRPTSPNFRVKLEVQFEDVEEEPPYIPKVGFILYNVSVVLSESIYICRLHVPNNMTSIVYFIAAEPNIIYPKPVIDAMSTRHVVWGKDHILTCRITIPLPALARPQWRAPLSVPDNRLIQKTVYRGTTVAEEIMYDAELMIKNVQIGDNGEYVCYIHNMDGESIETTVYVNISDPNITFIHVTVDGTDDALITLNEGDTAVWKIDIDTYPEDFNMTWLMPDLSEIKVIENDANGKLLHSNEGIFHYFRISNLNLRDNGNHMLRIYTSTDVHETILQLRVKTRPIVHIQKHLLYHAPGDPVIFTCSARASPLSNITWLYIEYPDFPSKSKSKHGSFTSVDTKRSESDPFEIVSSANIFINMTGDLICTSCNEVACATATEPILVSNVGTAFAILDPGIVTEGDNIRLTCIASVYNYTSNLRWTGDQYERLASEITGTTVLKHETNFTHQSILQILGINKSHSGEYSCTGVNREFVSETVFYNLTVEDARKPSVISGNMNESEVVINSKMENKGFRLECVTDGRPVPKVTWRKDKDAPFTNGERFSIVKNNTVLHIKYFKEGDSGRYYCRAENRLGIAEHYTDIILGEGSTQNNVIWITLICVLIVIIIVVTTYMGIKLHRERVLKKQICDQKLKFSANLLKIDT